MLAKPMQNYIKHLNETEEISVAKIADIMDCDWRTAKKYANKEDWNAKIQKRGRLSPVINPVKEIIDTWLEEDILLPRKQRHTSKKIFKSLVSKYKFEGGYRTVCTYVSKKKNELKTGLKEAHERLEHLGGEAQVDFYTGKICRDSALIDQKILVMSFPNSNGAFVHPLPAENQECFFEGLKILFAKLGKVPSAIWFDNLTAAVISIQKGGQRTLTQMFNNFACHYRFKPIFCAPGKGNEKGNVEKKCGYSRCNWLVPIPIVNDYEHFCLELDILATEDMQRSHYSKGQKICELLEQEKYKMLSLPNIDFEAYKLESATVNKYGEVTINKTPIKVFETRNGEELLVKCYWNRYEFLNSDYILVQTSLRDYMLRPEELPWKEVFKNFLKKPRSVSHSHFAQMLPNALKSYISVENLEMRKERLIIISKLVSVYHVNEIAETLLLVGLNAKIGEITIALPTVVKRSRQIESSFEESYTPLKVKQSNLTLDAYNLLMRGGELQ